MMKMARNFALFTIFTFVGSACSPAGPSEIMTMEDLVDQLKDAGFKAVPGELVENAALGSDGRILEWDSVRVEVYEFVDPDARGLISDEINRMDMTRNGIPIVTEGFLTLWVKGSIIVLYQGLEGGTIMLLNGLLGDPISYEGDTVDEPYPPAVVAAIRYVAQQMGLDPGLVQVEDYEQVDWANGCLELPGQDEACTEAITPGWRIELRADDTELEVRSDLSGSILRSLLDGQ